MSTVAYWKGILDDPKDYEKIGLYNTVPELISNTCKSFKDHIAIDWNEKTFSYGKMYDDICALQDYFIKQGYKSGENIGLLFKNEYDFVISFFALTSLGVTCALLPSTLSIEKCKALAGAFRLRKIITNNKCTFANDDICVSLNDIELSNDVKDLVKFDIQKDTPACIVFTGGTTGIPKGAVLSHRNLCRGAFNGVLTKGKIFNLRYFSLIPFTHVFGLVKNLMSSFLSGSTLHICENPAGFAKEAKIFKPQVMVLTPGLGTIVCTLMKNFGADFFGNDFKTIISGGAHVPVALVDDFKKLGIECFPGYGLTEAANLVSGNITIDTKNGSVGILYPEQEGKIVDGELYVKGDNVFLRYFGNPVATEKMFDGEWLKTGDLAYFDEDGFLYIKGRKNNVIVLSNGFNISPEEIENDICKNPLVKDCIIKKDTDSDQLVCEMVLFDNSEEKQNQVKEFLVNVINKEITEGSFISKMIFRTEDFERTPAMKIIRK